MSDEQEQFTPRPAMAQGENLRADVARALNILEDMIRFLTSAQRIVDRGRKTYFDPADDTQQLAMSAIVINLATAAGRLPDQVKDIDTEVPWRELKATRNYLAHDYAGSSQPILWETAVRDFPPLRRQICELREGLPQPETNGPQG